MRQGQLRAITDRSMHMPRCRKCGEKYDEEDGLMSPVEALGELFLESAGEEPCDLCPACREELGMFALLGFDV